MKTVGLKVHPGVSYPKCNMQFNLEIKIVQRGEGSRHELPHLSVHGCSSRPTPLLLNLGMKV